MAKFQLCPAHRANIDSPTRAESDPPHRRRLCAKSDRDNIACRAAARGAADICKCPDIRRAKPERGASRDNCSNQVCPTYFQIAPPHLLLVNPTPKALAGTAL